MVGAQYEAEHSIVPSAPAPAAFEVVERKGVGHPDTLADALGERLSVVSRNTRGRSARSCTTSSTKSDHGRRCNVRFGGGGLTHRSAS